MNGQICGPFGWGQGRGLLQGALEFATSPHARRPQFAAPLGIPNRMPAWQKVVTEIRENVGDGD